ncbi:RNA polymerase sigma factor (TIGR02999 family) [Sphingopyxis panaciterrae]|uniref:ECF-type sigma factor n=1 Tax=Sphingopyxis panaciterrae TaxID=363841 RepID=UPI00141D967E|nr:ECF-type sigma factor [Sphingopyxis panaciterrae]NIJ37181.1 RNA polymerase sigma factor (TIGR02999 family) [Sphingopyxis panaciterrae]
MPAGTDTPPEKKSSAQDFEGASSGELMAALYDELHRLARRERWSAGRPDSLQTTAIMHEAYLKLYTRGDWSSREHFLGAAVTTMRNILVDAARARLAIKRGSGERALPLEAARDVVDGDGEGDHDLVRLDDALRDLAGINPNLAKLVDCRFFGGLTDGEAAKVMGVSDRTIQRWWVSARAWIHSELEMAN